MNETLGGLCDQDIGETVCTSAGRRKDKQSCETVTANDRFRCDWMVHTLDFSEEGDELAGGRFFG